MESQKWGEWTKSTNICAVCRNISLIFLHILVIAFSMINELPQLFRFFIEDCSCTEVEATSTGTTYGKCQHNAETNEGWWLYGPICYVNEPTTCPEQTSYPYYRRSTLNQMFYSWEACEQNFNHMRKFNKLTVQHLMMRHFY